jgi:hypothetical protein
MPKTSSATISPENDMVVLLAVHTNFGGVIDSSAVEDDTLAMESFGYVDGATIPDDIMHGRVPDAAKLALEAVRDGDRLRERLAAVRIPVLSLAVVTVVEFELP